MEKFVNQYKSCSCCQLKLHIYLFPVSNGTRYTITCIACQRDCGKTCRLGATWGCAECPVDSPHPVTGHGGKQRLLRGVKDASYV